VNKKLSILLFVTLFSALASFAQINNKFWIQGKVIDSAGVVKDVHVVNLKTQKGTFTNDFGDYKMIVSIGDTIRYTSVNHQTVKRVVNNFIYTSEVLDVFMPVATLELDEFDLKRHDLDGYLSLDLKKTPVDRKAEALKNTMDFSGVDMRVEYDGDYIDQNVRPEVVRVDPTMAFVGAGATAIIPFKYSERLWAMRRKVQFQEEFPKMLLSEFGEKFFQDDLGIPKNRYYHFLEYCNPLGIEKLYQQNRKIELINILRRESKKYKKLIDEEAKE
jgi:hypothetical protein